MVQLLLMDYFRCKDLTWDDAVVPMKDLGNLLDKYNLTKCKIREVFIHTKEYPSIENLLNWL